MQIRWEYLQCRHLNEKSHVDLREWFRTNNDHESYIIIRKTSIFANFCHNCAQNRRDLSHHFWSPWRLFYDLQNRPTFPYWTRFIFVLESFLFPKFPSDLQQRQFRPTTHRVSEILTNHSQVNKMQMATVTFSRFPDDFLLLNQQISTISCLNQAKPLHNER